MPDLTILIPILIVAIYLFSSIKILAEYERAVVFRLGRVLPQHPAAAQEVGLPHEAGADETFVSGSERLGWMSKMGWSCGFLASEAAPEPFGCQPRGSWAALQ